MNLRGQSIHMDNPYGVAGLVGADGLPADVFDKYRCKMTRLVKRGVLSTELA
jgi:hypothetical protein